jgi:hypothetical protein
MHEDKKIPKLLHPFRSINSALRRATLSTYNLVVPPRSAQKRLRNRCGIGTGGQKMGDFVKGNLVASVSMGKGKHHAILLKVKGTLEPDKQEAFRLEFIALANKYALKVLSFDVAPE